MKNRRLAIRAQDLQANPAEAEVVLRVCGIANAVTSIARTFVDTSAEVYQVAEQRDMVCRWIVVASYLKEAVVILNKRHDGLAWNLATLGVKAGVTMPNSTPLDRLQSLMDEESEFIQSCDRIRDKFGFHVDREPMMDWVTERPPDNGVIIMSQLGPENQHLVFDAAGLAVLEAVEALMVNDFDKTVAEVVLALPWLVEAMVRGFAVSKGFGYESRVEGDNEIVYFRSPDPAKGEGAAS